MKNEKLKLRALTRGDIDKTLTWHNQEDIRDTYLGHPFPVNREKEEAWYQKVLTNDLPLSVFGIELIDEHKLIGITALKNINLINREAEFAIYIGDNEERGKGFSKIATKLILEFGFWKLGLNRIFLKVEEQNNVAIKLYNSIGFVSEGVLRKAVFKNNCFRNVMIMSVLKEEFESLKQ
jgi:RimJ/RimL family protein N-acetyltransferase